MKSLNSGLLFFHSLSIIYSNFWLIKEANEYYNEAIKQDYDDKVKKTEIDIKIYYFVYLKNVEQ
jgi:hypothetical protein